MLQDAVFRVFGVFFDQHQLAAPGTLVFRRCYLKKDRFGVARVCGFLVVFMRRTTDIRKPNGTSCAETLRIESSADGGLPPARRCAVVLLPARVCARLGGGCASSTFFEPFFSRVAVRLVHLFSVLV